MRNVKNRAASKAAGLARARLLYKANLWWLEGYPLGVSSEGALKWMALPAITRHAAVVVELNSHLLSRATYTIKKLYGEFPRALPRIVGDAREWADFASILLKLIQKRLRSPAPDPVNLFHLTSIYSANLQRRARALDIAGSRVSFRQLLESISWVYVTTPQKLKPALNWIEENAGGVETILCAMKADAINLVIRLLQLHSLETSRSLDALLKLLTDRRIHMVPLWIPDQYSNQIRSFITDGMSTAAEPPQSDLGPELAALCEWLMQTDANIRGRFLSFLNASDPVMPLDEWQRWWAQTDKLVGNARRLTAGRRWIKRDEFATKALSELWDDHLRNAPAPIVGRHWIESLQILATLKSQLLYQEIMKVLKLLPKEMFGSMLRTNFLLEFSYLIRQIRSRERYLLMILGGFRRYLKRAPVLSEAWLRPWNGFSSTRAVEAIIVEQDVPVGKVILFYELLASVALSFQDGLTVKEVEQLCRIFCLTDSPEQARCFFESLSKKGCATQEYSIAVMRLASAICGDAPEEFVDVAETLRRQEEEDGLPAGARIIIKELSAAGHSQPARELILSAQFHDLLSCGRKVVLLKASGLLKIPGPKSFDEARAIPEWALRFPENLHAALANLSAVDPNAETTASKILGADFPDAHKLHLEMLSIQNSMGVRSAQALVPLQRRLANLKSRKTQPRLPGPGRMQHLQTKLIRAAQRVRLLQWQKQLDELLRPALQELIGIEQVPDWMAVDRNLMVLAQAAQLSEAQRKLALRLFRKRAELPPWDLREDEANRTFLERVSQRSVNLRPWLDGIGQMIVKSENGEVIDMAMEEDPLEIFLMGSYFRTCLSPGAINYFSVFANAADINKRVLYAFDSGRRVVGRCLLALTSEGGILIFHPYCHDSSLGFDRLVLDFARKLAKRMNTIIVPRGKVETLVSTRWYDDGPLGLSELFPFLEEGSDFQSRLLTMDVDQFVPELLTKLSPLPLNELTLPNILALKELQRRPELVIPLLPYIEQAEALTDQTIMDAASLTENAGMADAARRLFGKRILRWILRRLRENYLDQSAMDFLLRLDPASVLTALRRTRTREVRRWIDEKSPWRLYYAAEAMNSTHQPKLALLLYQRLMTLNITPSTLRNTAAVRIQALTGFQ